MGIAGLEIGRQQQGRKLLFQYLNLEPFSEKKNEVLFRLAESYLRDAEVASAHRLYDRIADEGRQEDKYVVFSRFRLAQLRDDPAFKLPAVERHGYDEGQSGDLPYLDLIKEHYKLGLAQEARLGLLQRLMKRGELDSAFEIGTAYLRNGPRNAEEKKTVEEILGKVLVHRAEDALAKNEPRKVYDLYVQEYPLVKSYQHGRLLYLIGQALQSLMLYDDAAVVYYRALGLDLAPEELTDLYLRRAEVYLAKKDLRSANILLKYLRENYQGKPAFAAVLYYSGRLCEEERAYKEALAFYSQAMELETTAERKTLYATARLGALTAVANEEEIASQLEEYRQEMIMSPEQIQQWYAQLGDAFLRENQLERARDAYSHALSKEMPQNGETVQMLHLGLGDVFLREGNKEKSRHHFEQAARGESALWQRVARERLNSLAIDHAKAEVEMLLQ